MLLKNILPFVFLFFFSLSIDSCKDEVVWMDQGELLGYDFRLCPCCGGYFIDINGETFRFYEFPESSDFEISPDATFPIPVNINWHVAENTCLGDEIIIDEIE